MILKENMNKRGQSINLFGIIGIIIVVIFVVIAFSFVMNLIGSVSNGNPGNLLNNFINAFIPLIVLGIIFEFIRRFFRW